VNAARESGDADTLATALVRQGWASLHLGQLDAAEAVISEASSISTVSKETAALVSAWRAQIATARGDLGARLDAFQRAVELYREAGDLRRAAQEESNLADTFNRLGLYAEAEQALRAAIEMTRRVGNHVAEAFALANLGYALAHLSRTSEALEALASAERLAGEVGQRYLGIWIRLYRARALLHAGELDAAVREAEGTADDARRNDIPLLSVLALALAARGRLERGETAMADDLSRRAMDLHDALGAMEEDETEVFLVRARALVAIGERAAAKEIAARGKARLAEVANRIADPELKRRFLDDVDENAALSAFDAG
jgi:tetratricopeptide (TPR) repeat protein